MTTDRAYRDLLDQALALARAANDQSRDDEEGTIERLRASLGTFEQRHRALLVLTSLPRRCTAALVDELVHVALSLREAMLARQVLGRLSHPDAVLVVPAAVWRQLDGAPDVDAYLHAGGLLSHLGLNDALRA